MSNQRTAEMRRAAEIRRAARVRVLAELHAHGFDRTELPGRTEHAFHVQCSQCEVVVINGTACHELGCPHETHECAECYARVGRLQRLCESCAAEGA